MVSPERQSDGDLVQAHLAGDPDAYSVLYERYFPGVHDFLSRLLRDRNDGADVTQDTFVKAIEQLPTLEDPDKFKSWLFAIAHRTALEPDPQVEAGPARPGLGRRRRAGHHGHRRPRPDHRPRADGGRAGGGRHRVGGGRRARRAHLHRDGPARPPRPRIRRDRRGARGDHRQRLHDGQPDEAAVHRRLGHLPAGPHGAPGLPGARRHRRRRRATSSPRRSAASPTATSPPATTARPTGSPTSTR